MFLGTMSVGYHCMNGILKGGHHAKREKILHADRCRVCLHGGRGSNHAYPYMAACRTDLNVSIRGIDGNYGQTKSRDERRQPELCRGAG